MLLIYAIIVTILLVASLWLHTNNKSKELVVAWEYVEGESFTTHNPYGNDYEHVIYIEKSKDFPIKYRLISTIIMYLILKFG